MQQLICLSFSVKAPWGPMPDDILFTLTIVGVLRRGYKRGEGDFFNTEGSLYSRKSHTQLTFQFVGHLRVFKCYLITHGGYM